LCNRGLGDDEWPEVATEELPLHDTIASKLAPARKSFIVNILSQRDKGKKGPQVPQKESLAPVGVAKGPQKCERDGFMREEKRHYRHRCPVQIDRVSAPP